MFPDPIDPLAGWCVTQLADTIGLAPAVLEANGYHSRMMRETWLRPTRPKGGFSRAAVTPPKACFGGAVLMGTKGVFEPTMSPG